jgi:penicillin-binding protein 2
VRNISIQAPRGDIVDRDGRVIVRSQVGTAVQVQPNKLPEAERELAVTYGSQLAAFERSRNAIDARRTRQLQAVDGRTRKRRVAQRAEIRAAYKKERRALKLPPVPDMPAGQPDLERRYARLGKVLAMSSSRIHREVVRQLALTPYSSVTLKTAVPASVRNYILEREEQFPGVTVEKIYLRHYPYHELAAQLFGTVGEVSPQELRQKHFRGTHQGEVIGKSGIEYEYDRYLRGEDGALRVQVDAFGRPKGTGQRSEPVQGDQLRLALDLPLQKAGQVALSRVRRDVQGTAGAFVALDPRNGEVLAMGSDPSFDPNEFAKPISQARYKELSSGISAPLYNRAIGGAYPTGSTFKLITALAGLSTGLISPASTITDTGCVKIGEMPRCNAKKAAYGTVDLRRAVKVSSDVYFYLLGLQLDPKPKQPLQTWARRLSLGHRTGIDLPGELKGTVPDRKWRRDRGKAELDCRKQRKVASCGLSDMRPWSAGDNVNLAIGQGDVQATPLQMATAYASLANGGKVIKPHLGQRVEDAKGRMLQRIDSRTTRRFRLPSGAEAIRDGLHQATQEGGTSGAVFAGWPQDKYPVFGKTGTAQRPPFADQSWYVCYVPDKNRPIVIAVTVEQGGFGADTAAPVARYMLGQWFNQPKKLIAGVAKTE